MRRSPDEETVEPENDEADPDGNHRTSDQQPELRPHLLNVTNFVQHIVTLISMVETGLLLQI